MSLNPDFKTIDAHLDAVRVGDTWVLTSIEETASGKTRTHTRTFKSDERKPMRNWIAAQQKREHNVYVPYNPMNGHLTSKPKKTDVLELAWLYVDIDPVAAPHDCSDIEGYYKSEKQRILSACENTPVGIPRPTICVFSGGGYQLGWRLKVPLPSDGLKETFAELERYSRHLEEIYDADHCHNLDRLLRLAGTVNYPNAKKRKSGRMPVLSELVWSDGPIVEISAFPKAEAKKTGRKSPTSHVKSSQALVIDSISELKVPDLCKVVIAQGCDPENPTRFGGTPSKFGLARGSDWNGDRSKAVWYVVCTLVGAGIEDDVIRALLLDPEWGISGHVLDQPDPERCADRQIDQARQQEADKVPVLSPVDPMKSAEVFRRRERPNLIWHNGDWLDFDGRCYQFVEQAEVDRDLWLFLGSSKRETGKDTTGRYVVSSHGEVAKVAKALQAISLKTDQHEPPCWLRSAGPEIGEIVVCANGILHLPTEEVRPHTADLFTMNALEVNYEPNALPPVAWLGFLKQLWPDEPESIDALQEIFGYLLVPDTSQQKIFLIEGPPRSGKGTIGRVLEQLVGQRNLCSPGLTALGGDFGGQALLGKQLALLSDARQGKGTNMGQAIELLLRVSGEDSISINRKNRDFWQGRLPVRFLIFCNGLPGFRDDSGALANRFVPLRLTQSFLGKEDPSLTKKLIAELPGILAWAIEGWRRLKERGHFLLPPSGDVLLKEMLHDGSPIRSFVGDCCELTGWVTKDELYDAYGSWCEANGVRNPDTKGVMCRRLKEAYGLRPSKKRNISHGEDRTPVMLGIRLAAVPPVESPY